jgi:hypothetical protein
MDKRKMVAMVAWLAAEEGLVRFFCRFVSARERNDWALGSGEFCHVPIWDDEIYGQIRKDGGETARMVLRRAGEVADMGRIVLRSPLDSLSIAVDTRQT